jgi:hypothetical protein
VRYEPVYKIVISRYSYEQIDKNRENCYGISSNFTHITIKIKIKIKYGVENKYVEYPLVSCISKMDTKQFLLLE